MVMRYLLSLTFMLVIASASPSVDVADRRELQDCPSICAEGVAMGLPDNLLTIMTKIQGVEPTCGQVAQFLEAGDPVYCAEVNVFLDILDLAAYCGCEGSTVPNICTACLGGGVIEDPTQVVIDAILGTYTCEEGAAFFSYVVDSTTCNLLTPSFDDACCGPAPPSTIPPVEPSTSIPSPVAAPITAPTPSPITTPTTTPPITVVPSNSPLAAPTTAPIPSPIATPTTTPPITIVPSYSPIQQAIPTAVSPSAGGPAPSKAPTVVAAPSQTPSVFPPTGGTSGSTAMKLGLALCTNAFVLLGAWIFLY
jgi:hypothetical protein